MDAPPEVECVVDKVPAVEDLTSLVVSILEVETCVLVSMSEIEALPTDELVVSPMMNVSV